MQVKNLALTAVISLSLALGATSIAFADSNPSSYNKNTIDPVKTQQLHHKHSKEHGHKGNWNDLQSILGVDSATLKEELKSGKSLAEIALAKGIASADLAAKMQTSMEARIDQAVKDGKLTPEKADKIKANLKTRIEKTINHKHVPKEQKCKNAEQQSKTAE